MSHRRQPPGHPPASATHGRQLPRSRGGRALAPDAAGCPEPPAEMSACRDGERRPCADQSCASPSSSPPSSSSLAPARRGAGRSRRGASRPITQVMLPAAGSAPTSILAGSTPCPAAWSLSTFPQPRPSTADVVVDQHLYRNHSQAYTQDASLAGPGASVIGACSPASPGPLHAAQSSPRALTETPITLGRCHRHLLVPSCRCQVRQPRGSGVHRTLREQGLPTTVTRQAAGRSAVPGYFPARICGHPGRARVSRIRFPAACRAARYR
jgi:hypothetical protein